jgi:hypothetical protein
MLGGRGGGGMGGGGGGAPSERGASRPEPAEAASGPSGSEPFDDDIPF